MNLTELLVMKLGLDFSNGISVKRVHTTDSEPADT